MNKQNHGLARRTAALCIGILAAGGLSGCKGLLDVELPTRVPASVLDDPANARTMVVSVQGNFECFYSNYVAGTGTFTDELYTATEFFGFNQFNARVNHSGSNNTDGCVSTNAFGVYQPMHIAIFTADDAVDRLEKFTDAQVPGRASLIAQAASWAGYALTLMGEGYCSGVINGGPELSPAQVLAEAEKRFTKAIAQATAANDAATLNLALLGRARVRLDLGNKAGAATDARLVPANFRKDATYSTVRLERENQIYTDMVRLAYLSVEPPFRNLTVDGVADPRVKLTDQGKNGPDGFTRLWWADKVSAANAPIRVASWEEAQLIMAEAELGQSAVDRINAVRAKYNLPIYKPANLTVETILAQVIEERRREFFLEGHRIGDMIRFKQTWPQGSNHKGNLIFGNLYCLPLAQAERDANPNIIQK